MSITTAVSFQCLLVKPRMLGSKRDLRKEVSVQTTEEMVLMRKSWGVAAKEPLSGLRCGEVRLGTVQAGQMVIKREGYRV